MRGGESVESQIRKAQRGSVAAAGNTELQRIVGQFIERNLSSTLREFALIKEKVEILTAERGNVKDFAVRRRDLGRLSQISKMKSKKVSAAPTAQEFNALVEDIQDLHRQLAAIAEALNKKAR